MGEGNREILIMEYTGMCLDYAKQHSAKSQAVVPGGAGKSVCCSAFPKARSAPVWC